MTSVYYALLAFWKPGTSGWWLFKCSARRACVLQHAADWWLWSASDEWCGDHAPSQCSHHHIQAMTAPVRSIWKLCALPARAAHLRLESVRRRETRARRRPVATTHSCLWPPTAQTWLGHYDVHSRRLWLHTLHDLSMPHAVEVGTAVSGS